MAEINRIWDSPRELGSGAAMSGIGSTAIAVLGGFALATDVGVVAMAATLWRDLGLVLLSLAVAAFVIALLFVSESAQYAVTPDVRLDWTPEARHDAEILESERTFQRQDEWLLDKYATRISTSVMVGIVSTLVALGCLTQTVHRSWATLLAAAVLALAVLIVLANYFGVRCPALFPRPADWARYRQVPPKLSEDQRKMLEPPK